MEFKPTAQFGYAESVIRWGLVLLLAVLAAVVVGGSRVVPISFSPEVVDRALDLLGAYLVVALFAERAQEVFVKSWRGMGRAELEHDVRDAYAALESSREKLADIERLARPLAEDDDDEGGDRDRSDGQSLDPDADLRRSAAWRSEYEAIQRRVNKRQLDWHRAKRRLQKYRVRTGKIVVIGGSIAGLVVAGAGFGMLADEGITDYLAQVESGALDGLQRHLFVAIDAVLTGGLIAGGSKGIHNLVAPISRFIRQSGENLSNDPAIK